MLQKSHGDLSLMRLNKNNKQNGKTGKIQTKSLWFHEDKEFLENHWLPFEGFKQKQLCIIRKKTSYLLKVFFRRWKNSKLRCQIAARRTFYSQKPKIC